MNKLGLACLSSLVLFCCFTGILSGGCDHEPGWIEIGSQCYKKVLDPKIRKNEYSGKCQEMGGDVLHIGDDLSIIQKIKEQVIGTGSLQFLYETTTNVTTSRECRFANDEKKLLCDDVAEKPLLFAPLFGKYSGDKCENGHGFQSICPDPRIHGMWQDKRVACVDGLDCEINFGEFDDVMKNHCTSTTKLLRYSWTCSGLSQEVRRDSIWNHFAVDSNALLDYLPYICQKDVAVVREPCPMGTYSTTGYPSHESECHPCEQGQITLAVGSNHCITECTVQPRDVIRMPRLSRQLMIFPDFNFQCDGNVSSLHFYAHEAGTFYFSSWRTTGEDRYTLKAYSTIDVTHAGIQTYEIPLSDQMVVESTDVIGIFYPKTGRAKIIPTRTGNRRTSSNPMFSEVCIGRKYHGEFMLGDELHDDITCHGRRRTIPLNAHVEATY